MQPLPLSGILLGPTSPPKSWSFRMSQRNRCPLLTKLFAFSSLAFFSLQGQARAETTAPAGAEKASEATAAAPASETTAAPAAPAGEASAPAAPATPKCECPPCPPPCPAPPPEPPVPAVEWKAQIKGGMLYTTGNSQSKNFSFGVNGFRKEGNNKLSLEGSLAYGKSAMPIAKDVGNNTIELDHQDVVSTNSMSAKARYDRFLTKHNTTYASGQAAADKVAGKSFYGGGQIGYSRLLIEDQWNLLVAELGYDFSYERYVQQAGQATEPVAIHSARVLVGETLSLSKETGVTASVEVLTNLNKETNAISVSDGTVGVKSFKDTRVNLKVGISTNLWKSLSFGFSFALKYDQNPAPRPIPKGAPAGATFAAGDPNIYADKVDTLTEATLIYSFF
jgi:hypothetical protein